MKNRNNTFKNHFEMISKFKKRRLIHNMNKLHIWNEVTQQSDTFVKNSIFNLIWTF